MLTTPRFRAHLHLEVIPGEGVLVLSETGVSALYGRSYEEVVPLIDGRHTLSEIVRALSETLDAAKVYYVLDLLQAKGLLTEASPEISRDVAAFWECLGLDAASALSLISRKSVAIHAIGTDPGRQAAALASAGIRQACEEAADLWLVIVDDYLRADLATLNTRALQQKKPWLLVRDSGPELWLGPLFEPGKTGCWRCLRTPLEVHRAGHAFVRRKNGTEEPPVTALGALPTTREVAAQMAAVTAAQYLADANCGLVGKVLSLNWTTCASQSHTLLKHPHCPACGSPKPAAEPLQLVSSKVTHMRDGGHRQTAPEETLRKYAHVVSPITGVVGRLEPVLQGDDFAHVYVAGHNSAIRLDKLSHLKGTLRQGSGGKGKSEIQAKVSALCEGIERYSGQLLGGETRVNRSFEEWLDGEAVHPNAVMRYSPQQYRDREVWNSRKSLFNSVPEPLEDTRPIDWTPLWSLSSQRVKYLPTQLLYFSAPETGKNGARFAMSCSNGGAAGNTIEEAILQGLLELIERDAVAIWWYNRLHKPGVAVESFGGSYLPDLADHYRRCYRRQAWALDLTSDLGIPVFVALSKVEGASEQAIHLGFGCHLDARIALERAFSEMTQMMAFAQYLESNGAAALNDPDTVNWLRSATVENQPYLVPDAGQPSSNLMTHRVQHSGDLLQDVDHCRAILEAQGMEVLVLDQTRAEIGMPVVKVVVPGLRHWWARFAPGRLYDVPVKMGWLNESLAEADLNPVRMFI